MGKSVLKLDMDSDIFSINFYGIVVSMSSDNIKKEKKKNIK